MRWRNLLFAHWPVPRELLRPLVPSALEIDAFEGEAWIGIVPFGMAGVRIRRLPSVPGTTTFPELNVRTYVLPRHDNAAGERKPGVWFFSLDAASRLVVRVARRWYGLPYFVARMRIDAPPVVAPATPVRYTSERTHAHASPAALDVVYAPVGPPVRSHANTLEHFLTERYFLFAQSAGVLRAAAVKHVPWPLQPAAADFRSNTMTAPLGISLPDTPPLLHYAARLDVLAWHPRPL